MKKTHLVSLVMMCLFFLIGSTANGQFKAVPLKTPGGATTLTKKGVPLVPKLLRPSNGYIDYKGGNIAFAWNQPRTGIAPTYYKLCVKQRGGHCGAAGSFIQQVGPAPYSSKYKTLPPTNLTKALPSRFKGKTVQWTVVACNDKGCGNWAKPRQFAYDAPVPAPQLVGPASGARAAIHHSRFSWTKVRGMSNYLFCISKPGVACPKAPTRTRDTQVYSVNSQYNSFSPNLLKYAGYRMNWTVASCVQGECAYQQKFRSVTVKADPPRLVGPANRTTLNTRSTTFSWKPVGWASHYLVCVSRPGFRCPDGELPPGRNQNTMVIKSVGVNKNQERINLYPFRRGRIDWTVAACWGESAPNKICRYQPQVRQVTLDPTWYVSIRLKEIKVHDDCDNVSPGDWRLNFVMARNGLPVDQKEWPKKNRGARTVSTGQTLRVNAVVGANGFRETDRVDIAVMVTDCDNDGIWTLVNVFSGVQGVVNTVINWTQTCGGEQPQEASGANDRVGIAHRGLKPNGWMNKRDYPITITSPGGMDCGAKPYTAHFVLTSRPN